MNASIYIPLLLNVNSYKSHIFSCMSEMGCNVNVYLFRVSKAIFSGGFIAQCGRPYTREVQKGRMHNVQLFSGMSCCSISLQR